MSLQETMNVTNCVKYLRSVNVVVTAEDEQSWRDAEGVNRWLGREKHTALQGARMWCGGGHHWTGVFLRKRNTKKQDAVNEVTATCPDCGGLAEVINTLWTEARDGTVDDCRPKSERWQPLPGRSEP